MEEPKITFERSEEVSLGTKLLQKAHDSPFLVIGMLGFTVIGGIGAYKWKTRTIPVSLFLIQLRVAAQGTAIGCMTLGMAYHMFKDFVLKEKKDK